MVSQTTWIGITIGVFFVGLLIGVGSFTGSMNMWNIPMQNQQSMMHDSQFQQQAMNQLLAIPIAILGMTFFVSLQFQHGISFPPENEIDKIFMDANDILSLN